MDPVRRIVLTGFMGAGKSTVGALLAEALGWAFFDADTILEQQTQSSIGELFTRHGESHFRTLEETAISRLLTEEPVVLALGGGALESAATRALLAHDPSTHLVFLSTPLSVALARCSAQGTARPVMNDRAKLEERYETRLPFYQMAHQTIDTAVFSPEAASMRIVEAVRGRHVRERMP